MRGLAALPYLPDAGRRATVAIGLLQATSLPFILTATQIGVAHDNTAATLSQGVTQASHALSGMGTQLAASLTVSEHKAVGQLHQQVAIVNGDVCHVFSPSLASARPRAPILA